ncbi:Ig-like domain repeat protein [Methanobrevibacter sp.]|uniref:C39 family peptidase n=1 Tax=Methanobrevibacter sp. TaxID=66852 RepID=UPI002E7657CC|nr:Ig-like domain repeat protein [Methanobrevibacter sp.]MEE0940083.1 cysteine peptidase family C39 domain-containing protein [Methanobrevibacter sp.]
MISKTKLLIICLIVALFSVAVVSAGDVNSTDLGLSQADDSIAVENNDVYKLSNVDEDVMSSNNNSDTLNKDLSQDNTYFNAKNDEKVKLNSTITSVSNNVIKGKYFQIYLKDSNKNVIKNANVTFKLDGTVYNAVTNSNGIASLKISKAPGSYSVSASFKGTDKYNSVSKKFTINVLKPTSILIGNDILLTNGYLKIYLRSAYADAISAKTLTIKIGNKKWTKKTNSEGIAVIKPKLGTKTYLIEVTFGGGSDVGGASAFKNVTGIKGEVRNPYTDKVPLKNGAPDIDYLPGSFIRGDGDMKYTLLKSQYLEVIKKDKYCLYLKNKLSKYVFFKTKSEPKYKHVIVREKWNVIERAINTKIVLKNEYGYWPSQITANLKGKSYTYPEVRDVQDTGYTCGPTSASMCSQVLRNYVNEWHLGVKAGTTYEDGSSTSGLKRALEKYNMQCSYYYKSSFDKALDALKKGGCALIFHTWYHYVAILDISADGKKVLVGNPSGDYDVGSHGIPTNWLTVKYMKTCFNDYDTSGLIVKLKYNLSKATKTKMNGYYSNMGGGWTRSNTDERLVQI